MLTRSFVSIAVLSLAACTATKSVPPDNGSFAETGAYGRPVKVMIISMFEPEGQVWLNHLGPWESIPVAGLSPDYPNVHCNQSDVCVMTTGMGHANAAASTMAMAFSPRLDL